MYINTDARHVKRFAWFGQDYLFAQEIATAGRPLPHAQATRQGGLSLVPARPFEGRSEARVHDLGYTSILKGGWALGISGLKERYCAYLNAVVRCTSSARVSISLTGWSPERGAVNGQTRCVHRIFFGAVVDC